MPRHLSLFYHDNCFDGASSAAIFSDFYRHTLHQGAEVSFVGMQHQQGDPFEGYRFSEDDNACVDFRYCASPKMNWWFDHHISAFQPESLRLDFDGGDKSQKFYDPKATSCARFAADVLEKEFGHRFDSGKHWRELIAWADTIDGADFKNAGAAVDLKAPAMQLMAWVESNQNDEQKTHFIELLGHKSLAEIAELPWIQSRVQIMQKQHEAHIRLIESKARVEENVVFFDLVDEGVAAHNKFISYYLFPECKYTVGITVSPVRIKVSVGSNPWGPDCEINIASLCEKYGGGGHPVVGAISLPVSETVRARKIAKEVIATLLAQ